MPQRPNKSNIFLMVPVEMKNWVEAEAEKRGFTMTGYLIMLIDRERQADKQYKRIEAQVQAYVEEHDVQEVGR